MPVLLYVNKVIKIREKLQISRYKNKKESEIFIKIVMMTVIRTLNAYKKRFTNLFRLQYET